MAINDDYYKLALTLGRDIEDIIPEQIEEKEFENFSDDTKNIIKEHYDQNNKKHKAKKEIMKNKTKKKEVAAALKNSSYKLIKHPLFETISRLIKDVYNDECGEITNKKEWKNFIELIKRHYKIGKKIKTDDDKIYYCFSLEEYYSNDYAMSIISTLKCLIETYYGLLIPPFIILSIKIAVTDNNKIEDVVIDYTREDYAKKLGIKELRGGLPDSRWA